MTALERRPGFHPGIGRQVAAAASRHGANVIHAHQYSAFVYSALAAQGCGADSEAEGTFPRPGDNDGAVSSYAPTIQPKPAFAGPGGQGIQPQMMQQLQQMGVGHGEGGASMMVPPQGNTAPEPH